MTDGMILCIVNSMNAGNGTPDGVIPVNYDPKTKSYRVSYFKGYGMYLVIGDKVTLFMTEEESNNVGYGT